MFSLTKPYGLASLNSTKPSLSRDSNGKLRRNMSTTKFDNELSRCRMSLCVMRYVAHSKESAHLRRGTDVTWQNRLMLPGLLLMCIFFFVGSRPGDHLRPRMGNGVNKKFPIYRRANKFFSGSFVRPLIFSYPTLSYIFFITAKKILGDQVGDQRSFTRLVNYASVQSSVKSEFDARIT